MQRYANAVLARAASLLTLKNLGSRVMRDVGSTLRQPRKSARRAEGADSRVNGETDDKTLDGALLKVESIREGLSTLASSLARSLTPYEKERTPTCSLSFPSSFLQSLQDDLGWVLRFRDVLSRFIRLSFIVYIHSDNNDQQVQMI